VRLAFAVFLGVTAAVAMSPFVPEDEHLAALIAARRNGRHVLPCRRIAVTVAIPLGPVAFVTLKQRNIPHLRILART
jgi:hypothetical protein